MKTARRGRSNVSAPNRIRLKPHDPFELIRLIAQTQQDPRKAVAELVQNALDAEATEVSIERRRVKGEPRLFIIDDGHGVHPAMERSEALTFIAKNIGHSSKRGLTAAERHRLMVQGQYGIGLLGFWSLGDQLEIKSRVGGGRTAMLRLYRDSPNAELLEVPTPLDWPKTRTELCIHALNERAFRQVTGTKLAVYLAGELRGQLLRRSVRVRIHDRMSRGLAPKLIEVVPERYQGQRLDLPAEIRVDDGTPLGVELYYLEQDPAPGIALFAGGTRVLERLSELPELERAPWNDPALSGEVTFDGVTVAAATRRGLVNDDQAALFLRAMAALEPLILAQLEAIGRQRSSAMDHRTKRDLAKLFGEVLAEYPTLELPALGAVRPGQPRRADDAGTPGLPIAGPLAVADSDADLAGLEEEPLELLPPGPAVKLELRPKLLRLLRGQSRAIYAIARDASGRRVEAPLELRWTIDGELARLEPEGMRALVHAGPDRGETEARAICPGDPQLAARTEIEVGDAHTDRSGTRRGLPDPEPIDDPTGAWRSRLDGERWQVNSAHRDYRETSGRARLRYLTSLFAKEILLKTHGSGDPLQELLLEEMAGLLACAERKMSS